MKRLFLALIVAFICVEFASADIFGTGENQIEIDFITISGDTNPSGDYGIVPNDYRIAVYEITNEQWNKFSTSLGMPVTGTPLYAYNADPHFTELGVPTNNVSWFEAAQFVNWLNTSNGQQPAYKFIGTQGTENYSFTAWQPGDSGYDASNPYRNSNSAYFLPNEDEWVKAAYWNGSTLQEYAIKPGEELHHGDGVSGTGWNYSDDTSSSSGPWDIGSGSEELNGTYDMMGNVVEWLEDPYVIGDYTYDAGRSVRGGSYYGDSHHFRSFVRQPGNPSFGSINMGFRIASIAAPNPLQAKIDAASDGDVIVVEPGTYQCRLFLRGKNITLTSTDPTDSEVVASTILHGNGNGPVITFDGSESDSCVLIGFTITGGASLRGGGIFGNSTQAGISHCVIQDNKASSGGGIADFLGNIEKCVVTGNSATSNGGGLVKCAGTISNCLIVNNTAATGAGLNNCDGEIINCTIADNIAASIGGGLRRCDGVITNCIIRGNTVDNLVECSQPIYCCYPGASGTGNIDTGPRFVDRHNGDYHLQTTSQCIDAGDPASDYSNEPEPNGGRINLGAFGNTSEAARTLTIEQSKLIVKADISVEDYVSSGEIGGPFNPSTKTYTLTNNGDVPLPWTADATQPWLNVNPTQGTLEAGEAETVTVALNAQASDLTRGIYNDTLVVKDLTYGVEYSIEQTRSVRLDVLVPQIKIAASDGGFQDLFGSSIAIDGDVAIIGAPYEDDGGKNNGSVYILRYDGILWIEEAKLTPANSYRDNYCGSSVSISGDYAIIGARNKAYIFHYDGTLWTQQAMLTGGDGFGSSVSIDGDRAIVGASGENSPNWDDSGAVYFFHFNGTEWVQEAKLYAADDYRYDHFGCSVSIDGNVALVGAYQNDDKGDNSGSAYIFSYDGVSWSQQTKLTSMDAAEGDMFGYSVSISGESLIVGAYNDDDQGSNSGSAYIFHYDGSSWVQQAKLTASDGVANNEFGSSVAIDGNDAIVGACYHSKPGSAYIYRYDGTSWTQQFKQLATGSETEDKYGCSVDVTDGLFMVGASRDDGTTDQSGTAYVFGEKNSLDVRAVGLSEFFVSSGDKGGPFSHISKSYTLTNNGNTPLSWRVYVTQAWLDVSDTEGMLEVGASTVITVALNSAANDLPYGIYNDIISFTNLTDDNEETTQRVKLSIVEPPTQFKLFPDDAMSGNRFGGSVCIDGNYAIVGASGNSSGFAYIFHYDGSAWTQQCKLIPDDAEFNDNFGGSVFISGNVAIVGANSDDDKGSNSGSAYVFRYNGMTWIQEAKLTAADGDNGDWFGQSVSIDGSTAVVGADYDDDHGGASGSAYVFRYNGSSWIQEAKLTAMDAVGGDRFGVSVSVKGSRIIVGAYGYAGTSPYKSGSAYIFEHNGTSWIQRSKLTAADGEINDYFGLSVSIDGNYAIVGAYGMDDYGSESGAAYIFKCDGASWSQQCKLIADNGQAGDQFGISVSIRGEIIMVGANGVDSTGAAYIFQYDGSTWFQKTKLIPFDGDSDEGFGVSVDLDEDFFIVGNIRSKYFGSVYLINARDPEYLTVSGPEMVSKRRVSRTVFEYVYQLAVTNSNVEPLSDIAITLMPDSDNMTVIDDRVEIEQIAAKDTIITNDTITVQVDRTAGPAAADWLIEYGTPAAQASQPVTLGLLADIISDGIVDEQDLLRLIQSWMTDDPVADIVSTPDEPADIVNLNDFRVLSEEWKK